MSKIQKTGQPEEPAAAAVTVRMYRHGLGDCFLVRLPKTNGTTFNMLIDCGLIAVASNPKVTMEAVVADIDRACNHHIDLVAVTHEHWDHVSGFSIQQTQSAFDAIPIDEVWYAWTEDPSNKLGRKLRDERESKVRALQAAAVGLRRTGTSLGAARAERVETLLQFFGFDIGGGAAADLSAGGTRPIGKTRAAFDYLLKRRGVQVRYRYPDKPPMTLDGVEGVRIYVLGPPEDEGRIKRSSPTKKGKEVYEFASSVAADDSLAAAFARLGADTSTAGGADCPFESLLAVAPGGPGRKPSPKLEALMAECWNAKDDDWRKIDADWTVAIESLALDLDSHTNNTCLVLAIELVKSGRVLLFPGDAQVGNWLSWQERTWQVDEGGTTRTVTGPDLLRRTVFYKVGHHGSHNATLRAAGLEQMESEELVAFVPVFKEQAEKNRWHQMPFEPLVTRLEEKTGGRLVVSDPKRSAPTAARSLTRLTDEQRGVFTRSLTEKLLYYEHSIPL